MGQTFSGYYPNNKQESTPVDIIENLNECYQSGENIDNQTYLTKEIDRLTLRVKSLERINQKLRFQNMQLENKMKNYTEIKEKYNQLCETNSELEYHHSLMKNRHHST